MVVILNFSSNQYEHYRFKVSKNKGCFVEVLNSDDPKYNGSGGVNNYQINIDEGNEIGIKIPSFGDIILKYKNK